MGVVEYTQDLVLALVMGWVLLNMECPNPAWRELL
jgi:hypothetical protein